MRNLPFIRRVALAVLACFLAQVVGAAPAHAQARPALRTVEIGVGRSTLIGVDGDLKRCSLGNQATADYNVVSKREVMVLGLKPGRTELYVWLESGDLLAYELHVIDDLGDFKAKLAEVIGARAASGITAVLAGPPGRESLVLRGKVATQAEADAAQDVAELYYKTMNLLEVQNSALPQITPGSPGARPGDPDMTSCIFTLAHATDEAGLAKVLEKFKSPDGVIDIDARSNSIIVSDRAARVQQMKAILEVLDRPIQNVEAAAKRHVLIEAKIVEVILGNDMTSTIDWIYETLYSGTNALGTAMNNKVAGLANGQLGLNLDYGKISSDHFAAKILPQLSKRKSRLITSPTTMTLDGQQAIIEIGDSVPTPGSTTVTNGATTGGAPEYKDAKIHLKVTPTISGTDLVDLDMYIEETSLGDRVEYQTGFFANQISTRKSTNKVVMSDKETLIIGGLIKEDSKYNKAMVPIVGNVPLLKTLFSKESDIKSKRELLIFVSVKILDNKERQKIGSLKYVNLTKDEVVKARREQKVLDRQQRKFDGAFPLELPDDLVCPEPPKRSAVEEPNGGLAEIPTLTGKTHVKVEPVKSEPAKAEPAALKTVAVQPVETPKAADRPKPAPAAAPVNAAPAVAAAPAGLPASIPPAALRSRLLDSPRPAVVPAASALRSDEATALLSALKSAFAPSGAASPAPKAAGPVAKAEPVKKDSAPKAEVPAAPAGPKKNSVDAAKPVAKTEPKAAVDATKPVAKAEPKRPAKRPAAPKSAPADPIRSAEAARLLDALKGLGPKPAPALEAPAAPAPEAKGEAAARAAKTEARVDPLDPARLKRLAKENFMAKVAAVDALGKHLSDRMDKNEMKQALAAMRQSACHPAGGAR